MWKILILRIFSTAFVEIVFPWRPIHLLMEKFLQISGIFTLSVENIFHRIWCKVHFPQKNLWNFQQCTKKWKYFLWKIILLQFSKIINVKNIFHNYRGKFQEKISRKKIHGKNPGKNSRKKFRGKNSTDKKFHLKKIPRKKFPLEKNPRKKLHRKNFHPKKFHGKKIHRKNFMEKILWKENPRKKKIHGKILDKIKNIFRWNLFSKSRWIGPSSSFYVLPIFSLSHYSMHS